MSRRHEEESGKSHDTRVERQARKIHTHTLTHARTQKRLSFGVSELGGCPAAQTTGAAKKVAKVGRPEPGETHGKESFRHGAI